MWLQVTPDIQDLLPSKGTRTIGAWGENLLESYKPGLEVGVVRPGPWRFPWEESWPDIRHSRGIWEGMRKELGKASMAAEVGSRFTWLL